MIIFESSPGQETTFRIKATPSSCYDRIECVAEDVVLPLTGFASIIVTSVEGKLLLCIASSVTHLIYAGVGIFANDNPVSNNSVLLADRNDQIGTIYCSSGSRNNGIGQWFAPNGIAITQSSTLFSVVRGGGNIPAFVGLQFRANQSLTEFHEGIYTCIIPDENSISRTLYIGIHRYGFRGMLVYMCTITV